MIEVGKSYYFIVHAYHHYIGTVEKELGVQRVSLKNCIKIYSCDRDWESFFRDGCRKDDTRYDFVGNKPDVRFFDCFEWNHPIPGAKND